MRDDRERLLDIQECVERMCRYAARGREAFDRDELIQTWMVHHLQVIGEASRGLSEQFQRDHPEVPWSKIIGMRSILAHRYFGIDSEAVWTAIRDDLPELKRNIERILLNL